MKLVIGSRPGWEAPAQESRPTGQLKAGLNSAGVSAT